MRLKAVTGNYLVDKTTHIHIWRSGEYVFVRTFSTHGDTAKLAKYGVKWLQACIPISEDVRIVFAPTLRAIFGYDVHDRTSAPLAARPEINNLINEIKSYAY